MAARDPEGARPCLTAQAQGDEGVMVRRTSVASLDSGTEPLDYGEESPEMAGRAGQDAKPLWNGSGGRWLVLPLRVVLWAAILIVGYRGVMAILLNESPSNSNGTASTPAPSTPAFPTALGSAYALQFGQVYLNFSPDNASERARELASYIPANARTLQPEFGWNGAGTLTLDSEQVASVDVRDAHTAVVTLLATVNGRLMELGVPLYAPGSGIVVSGMPAWLPAPSAASPPATRVASSDPAARSALSSQLPDFFRAYASGDQATLNRFLAPGVSVSGLGGAVSFGSIASITVPRGGATREITVTVNWVLPGQVNQAPPQLAATYDMSVLEQQTGRWYVRDIRASTQPMGTQ
jgi:Conjugative transposon protein TcpC